MAMPSRTWIKICGITIPSDVEMLVASGADAIGLNFVSWSKRRIDVTLGRKLSEIANKRVEVVGVVCDLSEAEILELARTVGLDRVQVHGQESAELLTRLGGLAFKAMAIASREDVAVAETFPGEPILVDAKSDGKSGGTGTTFDWSLVKELCRSRRVVLAGGLHPGNVAEAILAVGPYGVDVASGVEPKGKPGVKDPGLVRQFVEAVRRAELSFRD